MDAPVLRPRAAQDGPAGCGMTLGCCCSIRTAVRMVRAMKKYPPTSEELRQWMNRKGLSNKDVAKALRLSDGRVVRFWTSKKDPRPIPYPSWYTLRHKFGK